MQGKFCGVETVGADPEIQQGQRRVHGEEPAAGSSSFSPMDSFASAKSKQQTLSRKHLRSPPSAQIDEQNLQGL